MVPLLQGISFYKDPYQNRKQLKDIKRHLKNKV